MDRVNMTCVLTKGKPGQRHHKVRMIRTATFKPSREAPEETEPTQAPHHVLHAPCLLVKIFRHDIPLLQC